MIGGMEIGAHSYCDENIHYTLIESNSESIRIYIALDVIPNHIITVDEVLGVFLVNFLGNAIGIIAVVVIIFPNEKGFFCIVKSP